MRILITGANGQVGWELTRAFQTLGSVVALDRSKLDLTLPGEVRARVLDMKPDLILNAAAYTAVDKAEDDEATASLVNGDSVGAIAEVARRVGALVIHYSTDYVFDGKKPNAYIESDVPNPLGAYGRTKLSGEQALQNSGADYLCLRTSWVYAPRSRNFLRTMLRLAQTQSELRLVADNRGAPTSARLIADATADAVQVSMRERGSQQFSSGIFHLTASGETSSYGFAQEIFRARNSLENAKGNSVPAIVPIRGSEYRARASRPENSRMACDAFVSRFGVTLPDWTVGVALTIQEPGIASADA